ncbi:TonB-dependent receptor [Xanthomonas sp. XNM01]|uniref:TonB-dependent receptor domain-containing protein n=1 Tax=Xanthomonas sp. XNM01 TaxID=2769289 RepID=UPI0017863A86|nr:TonB-dependent receptor [Xanthomonas sp. XNM01]MBD9367253.1 TonB-dependent receptor [Xanthomonas sp. XNM01]
MKCRTSKLRDAIVLSLAVSTTTLAGTGIALAQDSAGVTQLDTISVTGTRIKSQTMTATSPVTEISAEEFKLTGATTVEDLVNQYPQLDLSFDNFQNNPSTGYATASLRGLGAERTLTLVNGRRMPSGAFETTDLSIIPAAMVKRVDVLTGGASAVYGADAVAGVVNFVLDDEFEGVSVNLGYSAYQHKNDNSYIQGLMDQRDFTYPSGDSGFDGISKNVDVAIGGSFGGNGHAVAWATWRENDALMQGDRDYSSCALSAAGTACGGSGTADPGNFLLPGSVWMVSNGNGTFSRGQNVYNYAPVNYYQRPDTRFTAGFMANYEINEHFKPYAEAMFVNRKSSMQIAESGTFGSAITVACDTDYIGSLCADAGVTTDTVRIAMYKRNVEGGPRIQDSETETYRIVAGLQGAINDAWSYDASYTTGRTNWVNTGHNDFLFSRINEAAMGCPAGSFAGCLPYDIWNDNVSPEAAAALAGTSFQIRNTDYSAVNAYVTGDLGFSLPWANGENAGLVLGYERRTNSFTRQSDSDSLAGNFAGAGGADTNLDASVSVTEYFLEAALPLVTDLGVLDRAGVELGYRSSDYSTSGKTDTFKFGLSAQFAENYLFRGSWNRAIRAPGLNDLYTPQTMGLWGGDDPCAGANPVASLAECARTGVTAAQYGNIPKSPADQYNRFLGGDANLQPEKASTWTVGLAAEPIRNLNLAIDYFNIRIENAITEVPAATIINACMASELMCDAIRRDPLTGDLWSGTSQDIATAGMVINPTGNNGIFERTGVDLTASYAWEAGPGRFTASFAGSYVLKDYYEPIVGASTVSYDCAGLINPACNTPEWRHFANLRYSFDRYSVGLRWRYIGELDYKDELTGEGLTTDKLLEGNGIGAQNYLDLTSSVSLGSFATLTFGVNNVFDREPPMVGGSLVLNGNSVGGYDQAGRYIFSSVSFRF